ncbi:MAG: glycosyltransferase family 2 protein [Pseudomonadota bacterium]
MNKQCGIKYGPSNYPRFSQCCGPDCQDVAHRCTLKFSVITAVYNSAATVGDAINSVAQQTYPDLEHIIVEGKCKNGSLQAVERAGHDRMSVVSEPDSGIYDALNKGIARSSGDIVGFVHSDDFLAHEGVLSRVADALADPDVDAAFCDVDYFSKDTPSRVVRRWKSGKFRSTQPRLVWMPPQPTLYVKREVYERFGNFDTGFGITADYDFILRYFSQTQPNAICIADVP